MVCLDLSDILPEEERWLGILLPRNGLGRMETETGNHRVSHWKWYECVKPISATALATCDVQVLRIYKHDVRGMYSHVKLLSSWTNVYRFAFLLINWWCFSERQVCREKVGEMLQEKIMYICEVMNRHDYTPNPAHTNQPDEICDTSLPDVQPFLFKVLPIH